MTNIAIENGHLYWVFPFKTVIFHSYVSLPEGKTADFDLEYYGHPYRSHGATSPLLGWPERIVIILWRGVWRDCNQMWWIYGMWRIYLHPPKQCWLVLALCTRSALFGSSATLCQRCRGKMHKFRRPSSFMTPSKRWPRTEDFAEAPRWSSSSCDGFWNPNMEPMTSVTFISHIIYQVQE